MNSTAKKDYDWFKAENYFVAIDFVDRQLIAIPIDFKYWDTANQEYKYVDSIYIHENLGKNFYIDNFTEIINEAGSFMLNSLLNGLGWYWNSIKHEFQFSISVNSELGFKPLDKFFGIPLNGLEINPEEMKIGEIRPDILAGYMSDLFSGRYLGLSGKSYCIVLPYNDLSLNFYNSWVKKRLVSKKEGWEHYGIKFSKDTINIYEMGN